MLEILAPAGNLECALAAINAGADAIYLGYSAFSARDGADNFDADGLKEVVDRAHLLDVKIYVAMNTIVKDDELTNFLQTLLKVWSLGVDAIIMQDILLGKYVHEKYPSIVLYLSTQAGVCTVDGANFAKECGFSRVILARETPIAEIQKITKIIETEAFVQGALCTAFSGECYFSSFVGGNSGNRGRCKQPCRKKYRYNRNGGEELSYALSLSDLCVGEKIQAFISAGVTSFKIEGRMRRAEYVAAAVRYYQALLQNQSEEYAKRLSDLKRAYNRGNYTQGLSFGQDKRFLSKAIQGHLGEKVGTVKVVNGKYLVESTFKPDKNDAFKILRAGKEIGGAYMSGSFQKGFILSSKNRLLGGDLVFLTTDTKMRERVLSVRKSREIRIKIIMHENDYGEVICGEMALKTPEKLPVASSSPLTEEEVIKCFSKTDGLPIKPVFEGVEVGNVFIPKSALNAFRREFYQEVEKSFLSVREELVFEEPIIKKPQGKNDKIAIIVRDERALLNSSADVVIVKAWTFDEPRLMAMKNSNKEFYLEYPAFLTAAERENILSLMQTGAFDGVYIENYGGLAFAKEHNLKAFLGTGLNLSNSISISKIEKLPFVSYYAISKELSEKEQSALGGDKAFTLAFGNLKLMELCYCPFEKTCKNCDKKSVYELTDEHNRTFFVTRNVRYDGECRFEVYNCADLVGTGIKNAGKLIDATLQENATALLEKADDEQAQKEIFKQFTQGHRYKSVT